MWVGVVPAPGWLTPGWYIQPLRGKQVRRFRGTKTESIQSIFTTPVCSRSRAAPGGKPEPARAAKEEDMSNEAAISYYYCAASI